MGPPLPAMVWVAQPVRAPPPSKAAAAAPTPLRSMVRRLSRAAAIASKCGLSVRLESSSLNASEARGVIEFMVCSRIAEGR